MMWTKDGCRIAWHGYIVVSSQFRSNASRAVDSHSLITGGIFACRRTLLGQDAIGGDDGLQVAPFPPLFAAAAVGCVGWRAGGGHGGVSDLLCFIHCLLDLTPIHRIVCAPEMLMYRQGKKKPQCRSDASCELETKTSREMVGGSRGGRR